MKKSKKEPKKPPKPKKPHRELDVNDLERIRGGSGTKAMC